MLSDKLNLSEQLKLIAKTIGFMSLNDDVKPVDQLFAGSQDQELEKLHPELQDANNQISQLNKSDIVEMKAIRSPPKALQDVAEATCILFAKAPSYKNFLVLTADMNFTQNLVNYDIDSVSDYSLKELEKYMSQSTYTPDYTNKVSKTGGALCSWTRAIYNYAKHKNNTSLFRLPSQDTILVRTYFEINY